MANKDSVVIGIVNENGKQLVFLIGVAESEEEKNTLIAAFEEQQKNFLKFEGPGKRAANPCYYRLIRTKVLKAEPGHFCGENLLIFAEK